MVSLTKINTAKKTSPVDYDFFPAFFMLVRFQYDESTKLIKNRISTFLWQKIDLGKDPIMPQVTMLPWRGKYKENKYPENNYVGLELEQP